MTTEKLHKVIARAGHASRRVAETMIAAGRVTVDGAVASLGARVDDTARIEIDGVPIVTDPTRIYYLLHKPRGVTCSSNDPHATRLAIDLVPAEPRVHTVGRLDVDSEGLLVLTNDGDLTHRLTHPSHGIDKEYLVEVRGTPTPAAIRTLRDGVDLDDGPTAAARVHLVDQHGSGPGATAALSLTIHEGRNRQVRRMCAAVGYDVVRLVRVRIGPVRDPRLKPGEWRPLTGDEVHSLYAASAHR